MKKRFILAALLAAAPFAASAQEFSYTYVEGGYGQTTFDMNYNEDLEVDGGYIRGSFEISDSFHLFGQYTKMSGEEQWASISGGHSFDHDFDLGELGVGYHHRLSDRLDLVTEVSLVSIGFKTTRTERPFFGDMTPYSAVDFDESSTEARVAVGVRGGTGALEGWAKAGYLSDGTFDGGFIGTLGGQVKFARMWGVVAEVELAESWNQLHLGFRASF